jgi:hypothetical protein
MEVLWHSPGVGEMFAGQLIFKQVMEFIRQLLWHWGDRQDWRAEQNVVKRFGYAL